MTNHRNPTEAGGDNICTMTLEDMLPLRLRRAAQQHHHAVAMLARQSAIKAVKARLRAEGTRLSDFSMREIAVMADDYLAQHRDRLTAEAKTAHCELALLGAMALPGHPQ